MTLKWKKKNLCSRLLDNLAFMKKLLEHSKFNNIYLNIGKDIFEGKEGRISSPIRQGDLSWERKIDQKGFRIHLPS